MNIAALGAGVLVASCSVKENRTDCPCYLAVNTEGFYKAGMKTATVSVSTESSLVNRENLELGLFTREPYYVAAPRRMNYVSMVSGFGGNSLLQGDTLRIIDGRMSDPVMAFSGEVACVGDNAEVRPVPHKQYCKITMLVVGKMPGDDYPYRYRVNYPCDGLALRTLTPIEGWNSFIIEENLQPVMECSLIRQKTNDITMDILREEIEVGEQDPAWKKISSFRLGALLARQGFDWTKEDLDDIVVTIDFSKADVYIEIVPWVDEFREYDS